jgi:exopolyphosphatase/guanosine-5'-triphosphate,3'-diphosphate pyrophosphatase
MILSRVAVIDIGSNSIKVLVAESTPDGVIHALATRTLDARISAGISQSTPRLAEEGIARGLAAIRELLAFAAPFSPQRTVLVATSAVRDAANGGEFRDRVRVDTGHEVRILSGEEEANLIGRGLTCDPALVSLRNFYVFDLGGGSLECLAFRERRIERTVSLQLGCVRLTEAFVRVSADPVPFGIIAAIGAVTTATVRAKFSFELPDATAVGTGGTITTARAILAARAGLPLEATPARIGVAQLRDLCDELAALPLAARQNVPGLPAARADVFPTALATLVALATAGGFDAYLHSFYNLRFGLAAELLAV